MCKLQLLFTFKAGKERKREHREHLQVTRILASLARAHGERGREKSLIQCNLQEIRERDDKHIVLYVTAGMLGMIE